MIVKSKLSVQMHVAKAWRCQQSVTAASSSMSLSLSLGAFTVPARLCWWALHDHGIFPCCLKGYTVVSNDNDVQYLVPVISLECICMRSTFAM